MRRYKVVKRIVELGSFSKAASELGYSQSAVSQMVSSLEDELQVRLLNRSRTGVSLTPEGEDLYPLIEQLDHDLRLVEERTQEIRGLGRGVVRMGITASLSMYWMPGLIKEFKEQYPAVEFLVHQGDYTSIPEWIKTGEVDFGFVTPEAVSGFELEHVMDAPMHALVPADHPCAARGVIPLEVLAREPFILLEQGVYSEPLAAFAEQGIEPHIEYTIHDDFTIMAMVEEGLGVSVVSELITKRADYRIASIPTDPPISRRICVAYRNANTVSVASRRFIDLVEARAHELP